jgi:hypothetical protein
MASASTIEKSSITGINLKLDECTRQVFPEKRTGNPKGKRNSLIDFSIHER